MRTAKASIKPEDLAIERMRFKRAVTGALTMEILGDKDGQKASALAEHLTTLFKGNEEIRIAGQRRRLSLGSRIWMIRSPPGKSPRRWLSLVDAWSRR